MENNYVCKAIPIYGGDPVVQGFESLRDARQWAHEKAKNRSYTVKIFSKTGTLIDSK